MEEPRWEIGFFSINAKKLIFEDNSFDVVISINTVHNLEEDECGQALQEIERVARGKSFITLDAVVVVKSLSIIPLNCEVRSSDQAARPV